MMQAERLTSPDSGEPSEGPNWSLNSAAAARFIKVISFNCAAWCRVHDWPVLLCVQTMMSAFPWCAWKQGNVGLSDI